MSAATPSAAANAWNMVPTAIPKAATIAPFIRYRIPLATTKIVSGPGESIRPNDINR